MVLTSYSFDYLHDLFDLNMILYNVYLLNLVAYSLDLIVDLDTESKDSIFFFNYIYLQFILHIDYNFNYKNKTLNYTKIQK